MSIADREKWERLYASGEYRPRTHVSPLLEQWIEHLPRGRALDVACGGGRHAMRLARAGFAVQAVDVSASALRRAREVAAAEGLPVEWIEADLDTHPLPPDHYQAIVCARYVNRSLLPRLAGALAPGGYLVYEHHLRSPLPVNGPRDPGFRLAPNELLRVFAGLRVLFYSESLEHDPDGMRMALARLVACRGDAGL